MSWKHGVSAYRSQQISCRCHVCREANTERARLERAHRRELVQTDPALNLEHGSPWTYTNWACRCTTCTAANTARCRRYKQQRREAS